MCDLLECEGKCSSALLNSDKFRMCVRGKTTVRKKEKTDLWTMWWFWY